MLSSTADYIFRFICHWHHCIGCLCLCLCLLYICVLDDEDHPPHCNPDGWVRAARSALLLLYIFVSAPLYLSSIAIVIIIIVNFIVFLLCAIFHFLQLFGCMLAMQYVIYFHHHHSHHDCKKDGVILLQDNRKLPDLSDTEPAVDLRQIPPLLYFCICTFSNCLPPIFLYLYFQQLTPPVFLYF